MKIVNILNDIKKKFINTIVKLSLMKKVMLLYVFIVVIPVFLIGLTAVFFASTFSRKLQNIFP
jgi:hypothetical protein